MAGTTTLAGLRRPQRDDAGGHTADAAGGHFRADIEGLRAVAVGLVVADHVLG